MILFRLLGAILETNIYATLNFNVSSITVCLDL